MGYTVPKNSRTGAKSPDKTPRNQIKPVNKGNPGRGQTMIPKFTTKK